MFSFGIVMWELLTGEEPYADLHYGAIIGNITLVFLVPRFNCVKRTMSHILSPISTTFHADAIDRIMDVGSNVYIVFYGVLLHGC